MQLVSLDEARAAGLTRYFTGRPCKRGHVCERTVSGRSCMKCDTVRALACYYKKPQEWQARNKAWKKANPDKVREMKKRDQPNWLRRYAKDREKYVQRSLNWARAHPESVNAKNAKRRAARMMATPAWADDAAMAFFYVEAARLTAETGIKHHVDHIIPLTSDVVCGLHVQNNLQVLTAVENIRKSNRVQLAA